MKKPAKAPRPSPAMIAMLRSVQKHGDAGMHLRGNSQHGGANGTIAALRKRGLVLFARTGSEKDQLTELGEQVLAKEDAR